ncbi:MAG: patatin-like phospholipase family protein [Odoribacter sp.]
MIRFLLFLLILFLFASPDVDAQRKKVGIVLSGGGAKGVAHIGVLKVLEEAGIPIDYISGTSMGAIVGGLYAVGYNARTLDSLVRLQNWPFLLSDRVYRYNLPFSEKESNEKYLISMPLGEGKGISVPAGFVSGQNIYNLFSELTIGYHDSLSFQHLPIPFSCVAANMVDGKEVVMSDGILPLAMRASMAIPGAFAPVLLDSMVLVDGGISNNFPVDVVKNMGAEITIGVDLSNGLKDADGLNSIVGVVEQLTAFMGMRSYTKNKALVDLYMNPNLKGYTAASFTPEAIDTMILRGERVARANWDKIMKLKQEIGLSESEDASPHLVNKFLKTDTIMIGKIFIEGVKEKDEKWIRRQIGLNEFSVITLKNLHQAVAFLYGTGAFANVNYVLNGEEIYDLTLRLKEKSASSLNLGFRFDTEEMASILLNTTLSHRALKGSRLSLTGRLNRNPYVLLDYSFGSTFLRKWGVSYMYKYNDINLYDRGDKVDNITFSYHRGDLNISDIYLRNFKFQLGFRYEYFNYKSNLYNSDYIAEDVSSQGLASYYASAHYETFDKKYYPDKGLSFRAEYSLYTDNMASYKGHVPFSALMADFEPTVRLTRRVYLMPAVYGRILIGENIAIPYLNCMGGETAGRYFSQQLPFYGIHNLQFFDNSLLVGRLALRYRLGSRHYVTLTGNYAKQADSFFDILEGDNIWGGAAGYAYNSIIGPIGITLDMSNWDKKLGVYFNLGFYF